MKIKTLIKKLSKLNPEADVILASDAEGNSYSKFSDLLESKYEMNDYEINFFDSCDIGDEITQKEFDKLKPAVILYPE